MSYDTGHKRKNCNPSGQIWSKVVKMVKVSKVVKKVVAVREVKLHWPHLWNLSPVCFAMWTFRLLELTQE